VVGGKRRKIRQGKKFEWTCRRRKKGVETGVVRDTMGKKKKGSEKRKAELRKKRGRKHEF